MNEDKKIPWTYVSEDQIWKFVTKAIGRVMYNVIETYEDHEEEWISTKWLRDYTDDIVATFPRIIPSDIEGNVNKEDEPKE